MRQTVIAAAVVTALFALPAGALAKCVNVRLSAAPGGETNIKVYFPGGDVMEGVRPKVLIDNGSEQREFASKPTTRPGIYRTNVTFPAPGRWEFAVDDGFNRIERGAGLVHRFRDVEIAPGQTHLGKLPQRRRGKCDEMVDAEAPESVAISVGGQLPPERFGAEPAGDDGGGGGGVSTMSFAAAGLVLLLMLAGLGLRRRKRART